MVDFRILNNGEETILKFKEEISGAPDLRVVFSLTYEFKIFNKLTDDFLIRKWFAKDGIAFFNSVFLSISKEDLLKASKDFKILRFNIFYGRPLIWYWDN
ncbi:MAG TPA: hypothetical protein PLO44_00025 [Candidatus Paceibacterota bacterium]|nr:hypothetical protein [Candidatus Paceibacterota bacterium]